MRLCVDMRAANSPIICEPCQIPTLDEMLHEFNGCTKFTKLGLNKGYHQVELSTESRDLTAFASHRGIFRYKRLIFGMSPAAEIYQREVELVQSGLPGVRNISDDIGGRTTEELLFRMKQTLQRLREKNLTINKDKCEFLKDELMGNKLSSVGISADQTKIKDIQSLQPPKSITELRSFLGMVTYCSKFILNFATLTSPLHELLKVNHKWTWTHIHGTTFNKLKELLLSNETLAYYNPCVPTKVVTDASPVGLGAVLSQEQTDGSWRPISYASRALTPVEQRYNQIREEEPSHSVWCNQISYVSLWHEIYSFHRS